MNLSILKNPVNKIQNLVDLMILEVIEMGNGKESQMTKTNYKRAALLDEHAKLLTDGFPEPMTKDFWTKIEELEPNEQQEIRKLFRLAESLKSKWTSQNR